MELSHSCADLHAAWSAGESRLLWTSTTADTETPVSAFLKLSPGERYTFLLESAEGGRIIGRHSVIGLGADFLWRCRKDRVEYNENPERAPNDFRRCTLPPIESLRNLISGSRIPLPGHLPPMAAGIFGYLGYDMIRHIENIPPSSDEEADTPDSLFLRPRVILIFDRLFDSLLITTPLWCPADRGVADAKKAWESGRDRLGNVLRTLDRPVPVQPRVRLRAQDHQGTIRSNMSRSQFCGMVDRGRRYIFDGDIYQVVLSQKFSRSFPLPPFSLYRSLRRFNPSPFLIFMDFSDFALVVSSPEILVRLSNRRITIRPLAGTRPRGKTSAHDAALRKELLQDPKERAEHLMLLDLGRNDVGRVSSPGSVEVTEAFQIENYSHVMHIVSNVEGRLAEGKSALDALIAGFPAGTVSGAPKVRAMEIIAEQEPSPRGIYAGALGYFGANGEMDTCIALRMAVLHRGRMHVQAGSGIVAASDPDFEYQESCNKAQALFQAAEEALQLHRKMSASAPSACVDRPARSS